MMSDDQTPAVENFEKALSELQEIAERLEAGGLTLQETLALFERGQQLVGQCSAILEAAELRLENL